MGIETAILGSAVIGGVSSMSASSAASSAAKSSAAVSAAQLDFEKEQYNYWKDIYGPLQEDLGTYYKNVSGEDLSIQNRQAIQKASQEAQLQVQQKLAQRGIDGSGLDAQLTSEIITQSELAKANVTANADQLANQEKMKFLSLGLGQGQGIMGNMSNTTSSLANTYGNISRTQSQIAQSGLSDVQGALGTYAGGVAGGLISPITSSALYNSTDNGWLY